MHVDDADGFVIAREVGTRAVTATDDAGGEHPAVLVTVRGTDNDTGAPTTVRALLPARQAGQVATELIRHANDAV